MSPVVTLLLELRTFGKNYLLGLNFSLLVTVKNDGGSKTLIKICLYVFLDYVNKKSAEKQALILKGKKNTTQSKQTKNSHKQTITSSALSRGKKKQF